MHVLLHRVVQLEAAVSQHSPSGFGSDRLRSEHVALPGSMIVVVVTSFNDLMKCFWKASFYDFANQVNSMVSRELRD